MRGQRGRSRVPGRRAANHSLALPAGSFPMAARRILGGVALAVLLAACSSTTTSTVPTVSSNGGSTVTLTIHNYAFSPNPLTVKKGTTVKVVNQDQVAHTVTALSGSGASFDTGDISGGGGTGSFVTDTVGTFAYHCTVHPFMHGSLTVTS